MVGCLAATLLVAVLAAQAVHAQGNSNFWRGLLSLEVRDSDHVVGIDRRETRTFTYDQRGNLVGRVDEVDLNVDSTVDQRFTFTYDQKGNVVLQVQDSDVGANGSIDRRVETTFGYDQKGNLVQQVQETDNGNDGTVD